MSRVISNKSSSPRTKQLNCWRSPNRDSYWKHKVIGFLIYRQPVYYYSAQKPSAAFALYLILSAENTELGRPIMPQAHGRPDSRRQGPIKMDRQIWTIRQDRCRPNMAHSSRGNPFWHWRHNGISFTV